MTLQQRNMFQSLYCLISCKSQLYCCVHCIHVCCKSKNVDFTFRCSDLGHNSYLLALIFRTLKLLMRSILPKRVKILTYKFWVSLAFAYSLASFSGWHAIGQSLHSLWIVDDSVYSVDFIHIQQKMYTSDVQNIKNQINCVTRYLNVLGRLGCFGT